MNQPDTLTTLFRHHVWANQKLFEACSGMTPDQLGAALPGTFGSIWDTLEHIVRAEQSYLTRISTGQRHRFPDDAPPLALADMVETLRATGSGLIEWAAKVQADDAVQIDWDGVPRAVPKAILMTQAINHATEHRAQIMTIMTQLGVQPPELDAWTYFDQLS